jgi:HlyD family secretion protein
MKPLERAVIQEINVRLGDVVKKDDILITFDPTINNAEAERLKNEQDALQAELDRLTAEFNGREYTGGSSRFQKVQLAIFKQRADYYREKMSFYSEVVSQTDASAKSKQDTLEKQRERLTAFQRLENMFTSLYKDGAGSLKEVIEVSISRMELEAAVDQISNELLELKHRRGTYLAERNSFISEWQNKLSEEMVEADRMLTSVRKEYAKVERLMKYVYLRAPCDAVVHEIALSSSGSAVREAEGLITLIPLDGTIELEAEIRPQDIGKVRIGSKARIKLAAYPFQKYGTLEGTVRNISESTIIKDQRSGAAFYRARITVDGKLHGVPENFRLIPGMEAECEIKCDRRRIITYVLYPLIKALDETAREP